MSPVARTLLSVVVVVAVGVGGYVAFGSESATLNAIEGYGPNPNLPPPNPTLLPTINVAEVSSWKTGETPIAAPGLAVNEFAGGLDHPRTLLVLPNGDVLVTETNAPPKPDDGKGLKGIVVGLLMAKAGAAAPTANRITILRDDNGDGVAEIKQPFIENLNSPFGMTLSNGKLYVANTDSIVSFSYRDGDLKITTAPEKIVDLPAGTINHHWTKDVIASKDGTQLYATVGSNSNVAENGMDVELNRAAILEVDLATKKSRLFASGLRNPNGLAWQPESGALWVAVNERDEIGSDLVPDYMTSVKDGGFYGWPYSYYGNHIDTRVSPQNSELVAKAIVPDYALGAHTASLGLTFSKNADLGSAFSHGAFVGQHGSWNRRPRSGYKVVYVPFTDGKPAGLPVDVLTGFINEQDKAQGRPVGVAIDSKGALLVADDVGNKVWRITRQP